LESGGVKSDAVGSRGMLGETDGNHGFTERLIHPGGVAEWSNAPVLKTGRPERVS
jgi:hypothetical protein